MIYFIREAASGCIKIGFSDKPWDRFSKMQSDTPGELAVLAITEGDKVAEAALHARFADLRLRGEWFRDDGRIATLAQSFPPVRRERKNPHWGELEAFAREAGLSSSHACSIMSGKRSTTLATAVLIYRRTGVRVGVIKDATAAEIDVLEKYAVPHANGPRRTAEAA